MGSCYSIYLSFITRSDVIRTKNGLIQGRSLTFDGGKQVDAYLGIPYGKPPIDELRFKKPEPADHWDGVKDCTRFSPSCPYESLFTDKFFHTGRRIIKNEDCLYLNVFAPRCKPGSDQPNGFAVMVWIHGGGFAVHTAAKYGYRGICKGLCTKDVIVVTINYRLGFFGFLCTGDENAKGNQGMWDQVLALKWVKENIHNFGGDPNNITLFGHSAGGVSVDLLALSPHSRDLFQKMYCLAGTVYFRSIIRRPEHIRKKCLEFAIQCGFKLDENENTSAQNAKLFEFFKTLSPKKLSIGITGKKGFKINLGETDLAPNIDKDFLPKSIYELRKEMPKKIVLNGVTEKEGIFMLFLSRPKGDLQIAIDNILTRVLTLHKVKNAEEAKKKLLMLYYKGVNTNNRRQLMKVYVDVIGEACLSNPNWELCHEMVKNGNTVYQYMFEYINPKCYGWLKFLIPLTRASHGTELPYIFNKGVFSKYFPKQLNDMRMAEIMTTYVANFAKYGNPNGLKNLDDEYWEPLTLSNPTRFLNINLPKPIMRDGLHQGRVEAWQQILEEDKLYN